MMDAKIVTAEEVKVQIETLQGPQGERGAQGPQGERGERGPQGIQGPAGARGEKGERGERGEKGAAGERGPQGLPGRDGADGRDGAAGARGPQGAQGLQGERGEPGPAGRDGVDGIQGFSPAVDLERLDDGVLITVQNKDGNKIAKVQDGKDAVGADDLFIVNFGNGYPEPDKTRSEIVAAAEEGKVVLGVFDGVVYSYIGMMPNPMDQDVKTPTFSATVSLEERKFNNLQFALEGEMVDLWTNDVELNRLSNLRFTGAVNAVYNGSEYVEVKIPTGGSGEGGGLPEGGEPHQMLVTDGDGNAKWEARTHWKEEGLIDVLPETTINVADFGEDASELPFMQPFSSPIVVGEEYIVTYNGAEYTTTAFELQMSAEVPPVPALGNHGAIGGEDTGEPFIILYLPDEFKEMAGGVSGMLMPMDGALLITLKIQRDGVEYHKLDPGYLPIPLTSGAVDVLPEMTIEGEEGDLLILTPFASEIVVGKTYTVTYNGTDYTCTAFPIQEGEGAPIMPSVGNQVVIDGEDTGEPFVIAYIPPEILEMIGAYGIVMDLTGASSATVKIQGEGGVKIDNSALDMDWIAKYDNVGETIVAETVGQGNGAEVAATDTSFFAEGNSFIAYVDNVRYDLTVVNYEGQPAAGNLGLVVPGAPGNGEPFYITAKEGKLTFFRAWTDDNDALHTISVYLPGNSKRVPNRKLPNDFLSGVDVFYVELANGKINRRYDEILAAYEMGRTVCIRTCDDVYQKTDVYHLTHIYGNVQEMYFSQFLNGKMTEIVVTAYDFDTQEYDKVTIRGYDLNLTAAEGVGF